MLLSSNNFGDSSTKLVKSRLSEKSESLFLIYRKFLKTSEILYNDNEIKMGKTKNDLMAEVAIKEVKEDGILPLKKKNANNKFWKQ